MARSGKVYLVGAGPGHPELLTLKAAALLKTGDVIVYDRLIQEEVLTLAKPSAERIYMGKTVGRHESRQDEIHELLLRKAREGKQVIRLKGGDAFVFGRGGEEAEYLAEHGVPFEVVPGVSSALAAPASAGIAVTHRDLASSVAIVTAHEANREQSRINWDALAGIDTLVFLMAVNTASRVAQELLARGRDPETPAAMIQMAFWHGEKVVTGTLASIADDAKRAEVTPPATLIIGEVVRLREKLQRSERDLLRRADERSPFEPAPAPDELLRLATGGLASQVLRIALAASVFDHLEQWQTTGELAIALGLNTQALSELLSCLASAGLVEAGPEGYRNLELASRYLVESSPHSLKPALLYHASSAEPWTAFYRYAIDGRASGTGPLVNHGAFERSCECLARFAAPHVIDKVQLDGRKRLLIAAVGAAAYRDEAERRWKHLHIDVIEAVSKRENGSCISISAESPAYDAILLSGLLPYCGQGSYQQLLESAAARMGDSGTMLLHDGFIPGAAPSPPEVVLAALGRHVARGGGRNWSVPRLSRTLEAMGFADISNRPIPGGSLLVVATKQ